MDSTSSLINSNRMVEKKKQRMSIFTVNPCTCILLALFSSGPVSSVQVSDFSASLAWSVRFLHRRLSCRTAHAALLLSTFASGRITSRTNSLVTLHAARWCATPRRSSSILAHTVECSVFSAKERTTRPVLSRMAPPMLARALPSL